MYSFLSRHAIKFNGCPNAYLNDIAQSKYYNNNIIIIKQVLYSVMLTIRYSIQQGIVAYQMDGKKCLHEWS